MKNEELRSGREGAGEDAQQAVTEVVWDQRLHPRAVLVRDTGAAGLTPPHLLPHVLHTCFALHLLPRYFLKLFVI